MLYQVNRLLFKRNFVSQILRYSHSEQRSSNLLYPLESRKLLKITGNDAGVFLQGLITNDIRHFEDHVAKSMYAMFLNNKGRVLYDTLIHQGENQDTYLIECDKNIISLLHRHLKLYKLKRLVEFGDVSQDFKLWAFIPPSSATDYKLDSKSKVKIFKDPRISDLGYRILSSASTKTQEILEIIGKDVVIENNEDGYKYLRYKLGVSEGAEDLPPGSSFPLEANCDYLHGVSFHKGCYIGQELTARVHHTGVVRKRIMPLKFNDEVKDMLEKDLVISACDNPKSNLGKLRGQIQDYGLGLVRIKEVLDAKTLNIGRYSVEVVKPTWWPIEAPKEKATVA